MKVLWCAAAAAAMLSAQTFAGAPGLDAAINQAIEQGRLPGAVLVIGREGKVVYRKAYGKRALIPAPEAMTADTIFDIASLTKVVATTSSLMKLFEQGKFRLNDKITQYIPEFQGGHSDITIRNLFTHFSGLAPDVALDKPWTGYETGIRLADTTKPQNPPLTRFVYSDINFILLGELVHRLSGEMLSDYARQNVFAPLGMKETQFLPPPALVSRIAPTERLNGGAPLRGVVHDPTARNMGGVAGHAGVFSTADDLARFAQMMLNGGELDGVRVFSPLTVKKFTEPQTPPDQPILRGLGWDIDSPYSGNRGELFPIGSYGHTGFTGTSMWIDPSTQSYVILLANSVHPTARPAITPLRSKVATIAAAAFGVAAQNVILTGYNEIAAHREVARAGTTRTGLDMIEEENFRPFQGKIIGLITNQTGIDRLGRRNVDVMRQAGVKIAALFAPEHGAAGTEDREDLADSVDRATGIKIFSLYAGTNRPSAQMLRGLDAVVFDIQDAGVRFFTYETTMAYAMEECAKAKVPFYVLDRPNPITGARVEGPLLDAANQSFTGYFTGLPVRHGMTIGELARLFNVENKIGADLTVIPMRDWHRGDWFDSTGLPWINPSPNLRSLNAATLYPGLAMLEYSKPYSVGRGSDAPFEQIAAPFLVGRDLAAYLNQREIPGVRVYPTRIGADQGVRFVITNREVFDSTRLGLEIAAALHALYPGKMDFTADRKLIGSDDTIRRLNAGEDPRGIQQSFQDQLADFLAKRELYLLYR
ncbi:MAG TPA: exo-beta-N-acetylmuramidase NamZ domain-containing protein [Bryobacteraceae bacterium]|nr:exo-beta-N-acetylmuramidase NamZ domain-containing protein [Bryobacteraceae bacterium]